uniref:Uncharacterized protein n=1 Tax=Anguilla anguilla TaxID=7936 RepID=A0A0E9T4N9_ANGAN
MGVPSNFTSRTALCWQFLLIGRGLFLQRERGNGPYSFTLGGKTVRGSLLKLGGHLLLERRGRTCGAPKRVTSCRETEIP